MVGPVEFKNPAGSNNMKAKSKISKMKVVRAWAVMKGSKFATESRLTIPSFLIFSAKWRAEGMVLQGEKVIRIEIVYTPPEKQ